ncbi:MAG: FAD binding domain-containing protein [Chloroflexota bacterium]
MNSFRYVAPRSVDEALGLLAQQGTDAKVVAGGTGLINMMKQHLVNPEVLIGLGALPRLDGLARVDGTLRLGALTTHQAVATSPLVAEVAPLLAEAFARTATPRIRNVATIGGCLVHGDPNQDAPVALLALDAEVTLASRSGRRTLPLANFLRDYYETAIQPDELLLEVSAAPLPPSAGSAYLKFLPRSADDYATVSAAAVLLVEDGAIRDARVAIGSCAPTALRCAEAERLLLGQPPSADLLRAAAETTRAIADPLSDGRGSAEYKRAMVPVFVRRALEQALARATAQH